MNRILLIVGGLLVGILAALFIVPVFVDWNRYRGTFEEEATRLLGRDVRVGGKVNLRLLPTPYIQFEKVRIADTQGGVGEPIFRADDFTIWLAVGPLFSGALEASEIELKRPVVTLVLDEQGSGNWSDLAATRPTSAFLPSSVSLNAVRITNGTLAIMAPGGIERLRIEHINGELAAASLQGPYKAALAFSNRGQAQDLRLSTAAPETDGSVRFKGTVRGLQTGASYSLDGRIRDILQQLKIDGEMTARIPLRRTAATPQPAAGEGNIDIKSAFKADTEALELSDIALSFEQAGRPQLAAGTARLAWRQRTDLDLTLTSKWLDLDRLGAEDDKALPLAVLAALARTAGQSLPVDGRMAIRLDLDQATLGGEVVSGLSVAIERQGDSLKLKSFTAALPGNSRIEASGVLTPDKPEALFDGAVMLRGASLGRLLAWGARGLDIGALAQDGSFALTGDMRLGEEQLAGRALRLQLGVHRLVGEVSWTGGSERKLTLAFDGSELDVTPLTGRDTRPLPALRRLLEQLGAPPTTGVRPDRGAIAEMQARVRFGKLIVGRTTLSDVAAELVFVNGNLSLPLLRFGHQDELQIELKGDIAGLLGPGARGGISGRILAQSSERLEELAALLDLPPGLRPDARRAGMLTPLRLAGRIGVGDKGPQTYDIQIDGQAGRSRVAGTLVTTWKGGSWRDGLSDLALTIDGSDAPQLLSQLLPEAAAPSPVTTARSEPVAGLAPPRVALRAVGAPKDGLATIATLDGAGLAAELRGRLTVTDTADLALTGDLRLATADLGRGLMLAGYRTRPALAGVPVNGSFAVTGAASRFTLTTADLTLAANRIAGKLDVDGSGPLLRLVGRIRAQHASLPFALDLLSIADTSESRRSTPVNRRAQWSAGVFELSPLARLELALGIDAERLDLALPVTATKAELEITGREGNIGVALRRAAMLGGNLTGRLSLMRTATGARLTGTGTLAGGRLDSLVMPTADRPTGRVDIKLDLDGAGLGAQGLINSLRGKGELVHADVRLRGLSPSTPRIVAEAILAFKGELAPGEIRRQIDAALAVGELSLPPRTVAIDITDGILRLAPMEAEAGEARVTGVTAIDLETFRLDSEWRLEPKPLAAEGGPKRPPIPSISVVFTGPVARFPTLDRRVLHEAFERELVVRKYERDVDELERIRLADEERRRQETERQRLIEQQESERLERPDSGQPLPPTPALPPPREPQKQTGVEPPRLLSLPRLSLLQLNPPVVDRLREPEPAPQPTLPSPSSATIPASAPAPERPAPAGEPPRRSQPQASPPPRPKRDVFRDITRDSP